MRAAPWSDDLLVSPARHYEHGRIRRGSCRRGLLRWRLDVNQQPGRARWETWSGPAFEAKGEGQKIDRQGGKKEEGGRLYSSVEPRTRWDTVWGISLQGRQEGQLCIEVIGGNMGRRCASSRGGV